MFTAIHEDMCDQEEICLSGLHEYNVLFTWSYTSASQLILGQNLIPSTQRESGKVNILNLLINIYNMFRCNSGCLPIKFLMPLQNILI